MDDITVPLPIFASRELGTIAGKDGTTFILRVGLDQRMVAELKAKSLDESDVELQNNTSDRKRFGEGSYEEWYARDRVPFVLTDTAGHLAALAWFGPTDLPHDSERPVEESAGEWDTAGFRSYEPYRGKGVMRPFIEAAWNFYHERISRRLWIETNAGNIAAMKLYEKLGFISYGPRHSNGRILLVK